jgi:DNA-binding NarL/FixJ family response regulator
MSDQHPRPVRVLVVEDNALLRHGLVRALTTEIDGATVGVATNLADARRLAKELSPHVVLLDHMLPDGEGAGAVADLVDLAPAAAVVMVTANNSHAVLRTAVEGGAAGFVLKSSGHTGIFDAVWAAGRGDAAIGVDLLGDLLNRAARDPRPSPVEVSGEDRVLLEVLSRGGGIAGAASRLDLPESAVARRVRAVATALEGRSTLEALMIAVRGGLIDPPSVA